MKKFLPLLREIGHLPRGLLVAFCTALLILAGLGVLSYHSIGYQARAADWVAHTQAVNTGLQQIFSYVQDAESAQRAFTLVGKDLYLQPYDRAKLKLPEKLDEVRIMISDNPAQIAALAGLRTAIGERMQVAELRIKQRRELGEAALAATLLNGSGLKAMENVRFRMEAMIASEARLLAERKLTAERARLRATVLLVLGTACSLGLLTGAFGGVVRQMHRTARAEGETRKSNDQLQFANNELRAFSYSVAHDLRAPLRGIGGFARVLIEDAGPALDGENRHCLDRIIRNTNQMSQLIDDLLALSRVGFQPLHSTKIEMTALARSVFEELQEEQGKREIEFAIADLPPAVGDPSLIRQVWINLLGNALKFTRQREQVRIEVGGAGAGSDFVTYFVRDNGAGFDMQYAHKLFGAFQRLHRPADFEGTGIGLALVQRIVQRHGGTTWAEGEENVGARFAFTMPEWNGG